MSIKSDLENFVSIAEDEVGTTEGKGGYTKYGDEFGDPSGSWCAHFVDWCAKKAGILTTKAMASCPYIPQEGLVPNVYDWYKANRRSLIPKMDTSSANYPKLGDLVIIDNDGETTGTDHIGIVAAVSGKTVTVIEGNSSDMVQKLDYKNLVCDKARISYLCSNNVSYQEIENRAG